MAVQDLWGEIPLTETIRMPVTILREQAVLLEKKTENVLQGNIHISSHGDRFRASFDIVAPSLDDYSYRVLTIDYPVSMYPLEIYDEIKGEEGDGPLNPTRCRDEESFTKALGRVLSHPQMRKVVTSLVAQSRENN